MKLLLSLLLLCVSSFGSAQILSINDSADPQSSYDPEDLIKNVMISSSCSTADTFTFQVYGAPEDLTTKSYGYFKTPPGSTFPFEEGVVLTTGSAFPAGNTVNTTDLITSSNGDSGDSDLEAALGQSNTQDATFIKFNFTPLVDAIDFRFIMASEEYDGNTECTYADSFAFLLREVGTSSYTNLAVLPDETPVSVRNINDAPDCRANTEYFEGYDVGNTNYGGRTKALTASSSVTPGVTYEIKLVVADQGDNAWDSAIFIEGGSFNIGGDLGVDRLIVDGNPGCIGTPITLDANLTISGVTFEWFKNGTVIAGETNSTLDVSTDGTYSFNVTLNDGCESTDEVIIEFTTPPEITTPPKDILLCETDGNGTEEFDFSSNEALVLGSQAAANFPISYHTSQANAEGNLNPLTIPYQNTLVTETIWMRIADTTQSCYKVVSFGIELRTQPIANTPSFSLCDDSVDGDDTNGIVEFDLSTKVSEVLGSQLASDYDVKFYYDQAAASAGVVGTEITTPIQNTSNPQVIYVRIENKLNVDCFDTTNFQLIVNPRPVVNSEVTLKQCDTDTDGITNFNLTEANQLISTDYLNETFTYYLTESHAETGLLSDQIVTPTTYTNLTPVNSVIYARVETIHGCFRTSKINLVVGATLLDPISFQLEYFVCDDTQVDNDNSNGVAAFDFSDATAQVLAQLPTNQNLTVTYYLSEADALAEADPIPDISNHRNTTSPNTQNIYVRVDSNDVNACLGLGHHITLNVDSLPEKQIITDYILCSDTNQTSFDLTSKETELIGTQTTPILFSYHLSEQDAINNIPIPNPSMYPNISNPQTIYVRAQFDPNNNMNLDARECVRTDMHFELQVNLNPILFTPDPIIKCSDQIATMNDLTQRASQITNSDSSIVLTYFESQQDLDINNSILDPTSYTSNTLAKTILVLATATNQCAKTIPLELTTILYPNLNANPSPLEECEIDNNGFDYFDLSLREPEILNGLNPADFDISYYEDETDAQSGNTNTIADPTNFENTTILTQNIYVRVKPKLNSCFRVVPLTLIVNPVPEIDILDRYVICLNKDDQVISSVTQTFLPTPPIDTQLSATIYSFQWYKGSIEEVNLDPSSFIIPGATNSSYSPISEGTYTVLATNMASGCRIPASTEVVSSYPPETIEVTVTSELFSDNNILEVSVVGTGEYEYRLDFGPWQRETLFENVRIGEHTIYVRDLLNCNEITQKKIVIGYPKFFTPNGDGYHDTWNIVGMTMKSRSKIYIFDRYGKLLTQISPTGEGWDGTFNGVQLPSSDYWFVLDYEDPVTGKNNQLRAHFTLKR
jgi:gliding motility-associated-like protein